VWRIARHAGVPRIVSVARKIANPDA
jgi:hypothetical protein